MKHVLFLILFVCGIISAQNDYIERPPPDSLQSKTYFYLYERFFETYIRHPEKAMVYANAYIKKAEYDQKEVSKAHGYYLMSRLSKGDEHYLNYLDSMIQSSRKGKNKPLLMKGFLLKGDYHINKGEFLEAWNTYKKAEVVAVKDGTPKLMYPYKQSIGLLQSRLGLHKEAINTYTECYTYAVEEDLEEQLEDLYHISEEWIRLNVLDSAKFYIDLGLSKSLQFDNMRIHHVFLSHQGVIQYHEQDYQKAVQTIVNEIPNLERGKEIESLLTSYFYLGATFLKLDQPKKSIHYFKKMDSIVRIDTLITLEVKKGYQLLLDYSQGLKNTVDTLMYRQRIMEFDSIMTNETIDSLQKTIEDYDFLPVVSNKSALFSELKKNTVTYKIIIIVVIFLIIIAIGVAIYLRNDRNRYRKSFRAVVSYTNKTQPLEPDAEKSGKQQLEDLNISKESIQKIMKGIHDFEKNQRYLNKKYTLNLLAKELKTNSTYLSKIINVYKEKSFSNYLHDLRVGYAIERLRDDEKFRLYSIKGIAEEVGFKTAESFSKSFHKKTGIYPSAFISKLKHT